MSSVTMTIQLSGDLDEIIDIINATKAHFAAQGFSASLRITGQITLDERSVIEPAIVESPHLSMPIYELLKDGTTTRERTLLTRTIQCLTRGQINTVGELTKKDCDDLMAITNFGGVALQLVKTRLADLDLCLKPNRP